MKTRRKNGFSLLEVLVSASIIAVLTVIGIVSYGSVNKRSRDVKRKGDIEQIRSALEMYRSDNGGYPQVNTGGFGTAASLNTGDSDGLVATYMPSIPTDPQPSDHQYFYAATNFDADTELYYGYCICGFVESQEENPTNSCIAFDLPEESCTYGLKNP
jgi:general secretion pathway protein G